jgi:F-type H+-transporting ATPase subunit b
MPQLVPGDFTPQLVWLFITFIILYLMMAKVALPRISEVLETRAERIRDDLDKASALKTEAEAAQAAYEKALSEARNRAATTLRETTTRAAEAAAKRQGELGANLAAQTKQAETRIAQAKGQAVANLKTVAAETAREATKRLVGLDISQGDAERAAEAAMQERR